MRKFIGVMVSVVAVAGLAACGGDDGGSGGGGAADKVAASLIDSIESEGVTVDADCVKDVVAKVSADDLAILSDNLAALEDSSVDVDSLGLSEDFFTVLAEIDACVSE